MPFVALSSPLLMWAFPWPTAFSGSSFLRGFSAAAPPEDAHTRALLLTSAPATSSVSSWPVGSFHPVFQPWLQIQTVICLKTFQVP